ncbi:hypothetical protein Pan110_45160 [Gimesia panareensis]|nr:hypothetical protein Pan110_45160 [Gimesia panareensis]
MAVVLLWQATLSPTLASESYRERIEYYFDREGVVDNMPLYGLSNSEAVTQTEKGVRIQIKQTDDYSMSTGVIAPVKLEGNFQVTAKFKILSLPAPPGGYGAGASIVIEIDDGSYVSFQRVKQADGRQILVAHKALAKQFSSERIHDTTELESSDLAGTMRLTRIGSTIRYEYSTEDTPNHFTLVRETNVPTDKINHIRLTAQNGEIQTNVEVEWNYFEIKADKIIEQQENSPDTVPHTFSVVGWTAWGCIPILLVVIFMFPRIHD